MKDGAEKRYFLGIDGGGTTTEATLVAFEGGPDAGLRFEIIATGSGGPSNPYAVPPDRVLASVREAVDTCFSLAKDSFPGFATDSKSWGLETVEATCLALAGAVTSRDKENLLILLKPVFPPGHRLFVVEDTLAALTASHEGRDGIVLIAGTGSNCLGVRAGTTAKAGGWGYLFGDEGSAYDLVRRALKAVFRAHDGRGPKTSLTGRIVCELRRRSGDIEERGPETSPETLLPAVYRMSREELASLCPVVTAAAEEGDEVAFSILRSCAQDLAEMALAVAKKLGLQAPAVALIGGTLKNPLYARLVREELRLKIPDSRVEEPRHPPSVGAAILAYLNASATREGGTLHARGTP